MKCEVVPTAQPVVGLLDKRQDGLAEAGAIEIDELKGTSSRRVITIDEDTTAVHFRRLCSSINNERPHNQD
jgi:hypothetical protein